MQGYRIRTLTIGNKYITTDPSGYINLTAICKLKNKKYSAWKAIDSTNDFLSALSEDCKIPVDELIYRSQGANHERSTWGHPLVALRLSEYICKNDFNTRRLLEKWILEDNIKDNDKEEESESEESDSEESKSEESEKEDENEESDNEKSEENEKNEDKEENEKENKHNEEEPGVLVPIDNKSELETKFNELFELDQQNPKGFIVDFDFAWKTIGYSRKDAAVRFLKNSKLIEGTDYQSTEMRIGNHGGKPVFKANFTIDGFKNFAITSDTNKSNEIRKYFIEVEKKWQMLKKNLDNGRLNLIDQESGISYLEYKNNNIKLNEQITILLQDIDGLKEKEKEIRRNKERKAIKFADLQIGYINNMIDKFNFKNRDDFNGKNAFYLAYIGTHIDPETNLFRVWIKYGITNRAIDREKEHYNDFDKYELFYMVECDKSNMLEAAFGRKLKKIDLHRKRVCKVGKSLQKELFILDKTFPIENIMLYLKHLVDKFNNKSDEYKQSIVNLTHKLEIMTNKLEAIEKAKNYELEILKRDQTIKELKSKFKAPVPSRFVAKK